MVGSFFGTWFMLCVAGGLWLMGHVNHNPNPTWPQLWILVATWGFFDVAFFVGTEVKKVLDNKNGVKQHES